jgi:hypothetical protein
MPLAQLTKSLYLTGLQCSKKLWKEVNRKGTATLSLDEQSRLEVGREVGKLARLEYANGVLITEIDQDDVRHRTNTLIGEGTPTLFETGFSFNGVFVRVDILRKNGGTWDLIEVKSSSSLKAEHIDDAAIQYYVVNGTGLLLGSVFIQHLNSECQYPDLSDLFVMSDVTKEVLAKQEEIANNIAEQKGVLSYSEEPNVPIGEYCEKPHECEFKKECWSDVPEQSIFTLPRLNWKKKTALIERDILAIQEIPNTLELPDAQRLYANRIRAGVPVIDSNEIRKKLAALTYPLYFLDFETDAPAIPRLRGNSPYSRFPFQYSCHIRFENGSVEHQEYLHKELSDPRNPIATHLLDSIGNSGTIIAYNASFEKGVIEELANAVPLIGSQLMELIPRFWDLLDIFKKHYFHPGFNGSNSIKSVLPIVVPELNYDQLDEVHDGTEAGVVWNRMITESDESKRKSEIENLLEYCRLDTLAMVEIHRHLLDICVR